MNHGFRIVGCGINCMPRLLNYDRLLHFVFPDVGIQTPSP
jgi:hypothetical protein